MSFESLGLIKDLLLALKSEGYTSPTPVQKQAIPPILSGHDVIVSAQTGTGKTAGFTLPLLQNMMTRNDQTSMSALIIAPTRELAAQIHQSVEKYGKNLPFKSAVVYGGVSINPQLATLKNGVDLLVATPGRLLDLYNHKVLNLSNIEFLILDEADRMLDMGFIHDIRRILKLLPKQRQSLLFSATFSPKILQLAQQITKAPLKIEIAPEVTTAERVSQVVYKVNKSKKRELLSYTIGSNNWQQVLVFTRTKHGANRLAEQLTKDGLNSAAIHGNKSQGARTRALSEFKQGRVRVLVATDIAARGIDIDKLPHVVNYDLPNVPEDYVHRVGRTGRASYEGLAVSLVSGDELKLLASIEKLIGKKIPQEIIPGYQPEFTPNPPINPVRRFGKKRQKISSHSRQML